MRTPEWPRHLVAQEPPNQITQILRLADSRASAGGPPHRTLKHFGGREGSRGQERPNNKSQAAGHPDVRGGPRWLQPGPEPGSKWPHSHAGDSGARALAGRETQSWSRRVSAPRLQGLDTRLCY